MPSDHNEWGTHERGLDMPDPCDYCDCDDVDQGTHALTCPNNDANAPKEPPELADDDSDTSSTAFQQVVCELRDKAFQLNWLADDGNAIYGEISLPAFLNCLRFVYDNMAPDNDYDLDIG